MSSPVFSCRKHSVNVELNPFVLHLSYEWADDLPHLLKSSFSSKEYRSPKCELCNPSGIKHFWKQNPLCVVPHLAQWFLLIIRVVVSLFSRSSVFSVLGIPLSHAQAPLRWCLSFPLLSLLLPALSPRFSSSFLFPSSSSFNFSFSLEKYLSYHLYGFIVGCMTIAGT